MDIKELEELMIKHSIVLRAIPNVVREIGEKRHIDKHPNGIIQYLEEYKREMLVVETVPTNAGKFIIERQNHTGAAVRFSGKKFFDSIEEAIQSIVEV